MDTESMAYKIKVAQKTAASDTIAPVHWLDRWVAWESAHRRLLWPLGVGVLLIALAAGGGWGWWWWQNRQAAVLAGQAAEFYPAPTEAAKPTPTGEKPSSPMVEHCKKALPLYQQITDRYPYSRLAPLALYYQANCQVELGKPDEAQTLYTQVIDRYRLTNETAQLAALRLGYLYARRDDGTQAIQQFQQLSEQPTAANRDEALYEIGRLREAENDKDAALTSYKTLQKNFPKSPWSSEAAARIKALGGEPAPPPAPAGKAPAAAAPAGTAQTPATPAQRSAPTPQATPSTPSTGGK
jgi:predicted negative regulator of RcsB-dependent stress response